MDQTQQRLKPNQNVPALIPLDKPKVPVSQAQDLMVLDRPKTK